jgi:hypothetical protein
MKGTWHDDLQARNSPNYKTTLHSHSQKKGRADGVAQVLESLPHNHEALSSNPTMAKRKKRKKKRNALFSQDNLV